MFGAVLTNMACTYCQKQIFSTVPLSPDRSVSLPLRCIFVPGLEAVPDAAPTDREMRWENTVARWPAFPRNVTEVLDGFR